MLVLHINMHALFLSNFLYRCSRHVSSDSSVASVPPAMASVSLVHWDISLNLLYCKIPVDGGILDKTPAIGLIYVHVHVHVKQSKGDIPVNKIVKHSTLNSFSE